MRPHRHRPWRQDRRAAARWTSCGSRPRRATWASRSSSSSSPAGCASVELDHRPRRADVTRGAGPARGSGRCSRPSGAARWPGSGRSGRAPGQAAPAGARRAGLLAAVFGVAYRVLRYIQSVAGNRQPARRQDARRHPARLPVDPAALEHHHRALDLLPREGPRPAGRGAGRTGSGSTSPSWARPWCTRRGWWRCWRCPIFTAYGIVYRRRAAVSASWRWRRSCPISLLPAVVGAVITLVLVNVFPARRTRELLGLVALGAVGDRGAHAPVHAAGAAGPAGGVPELRGLPRGAADADEPAAAERVGADDDHELARSGWPTRCPIVLLWGAALRRSSCSGRVVHRQPVTRSATPRRRRAPTRKVRRALPRPRSATAAGLAAAGRSASSCSRTCGCSSATPPSGAS